jgi:ferredoxin--NADP+ reductase
MESSSFFEVPLRDAVMHLYKPAAPAIGRVVKSEICTASKKAAGFVRHVEIDVSGTELVGKCIPGQSIGVIAPGVDAKGLTHKVRLYSLASPTGGESGDGTILSTTVKRTIDEHWENHTLFRGVCSNFLCDAQVGDALTLTGPAGRKFVLPADASNHDYIFFATGTGIAPFRGMLMDLLKQAPTSRVVLIMGSPYSSDLIYHAQFEAIAAKHPQFVYLPTISREDNQGQGKLYVQDRLRTHGDLLRPMLSNGRTLVYICGIAGMELGIFQHLAKLLPSDARELYLNCDQETLAGVAGWQRSMLHKQIHLTKRVFMEVYA